MKILIRLYNMIRVIIVSITFVMVAIPIKHYVMTMAYVKSESMMPTLEDGEYVLVNRIRRLTMAEYERGDIIMFEVPSEIKTIEETIFGDPVAVYEYEPEGVLNKIIYYGIEITKKSYVKRIVAVGGDTLEFKDSTIYVNGKEVKEDYLPEGTITEPRVVKFIKVPEGCVYVLGDNRENSVDSRYLGCIPVEKIEGKILFR